MILRFSSGSRTPVKRAEEKLARVDMDERNVVVAAKQADDFFGLALAQQAVVDEDAGQAGRRSPRGSARAATAESTPPERPQITRPVADLRADLRRSPRRGRRAIVQSAFSAGDVVRRNSQISLAPSGVCTTSRWNCTP